MAAIRLWTVLLLGALQVSIGMRLAHHRAPLSIGLFRRPQSNRGESNSLANENLPFPNIRMAPSLPDIAEKPDRRADSTLPSRLTTGLPARAR